MPTQQWLCDECGQEYDTFREAEACEEDHEDDEGEDEE